MIRHIYNIKFKNKLLVTYLILALAPLILLTALVIGVFTRHSEDIISKNGKQIIQQVGHTVDNYSRSVAKIVDYIGHAIMQKSLFELTSVEEVFWAEDSVAIKKILTDICKSYSEITGILVATENDLFIAEGMQRIARDSFQDEKWYQLAIQNPKKLHIISTPQGRNIKTRVDYASEEVFSVVKSIVEPKSNKVLGVILVDINHTIIKDAISSTSIGENGFVFMLNAENEVVYTPVNEVIYRIPFKTWESGEQTFTMKIEGLKYKVQSVVSPYSGWKVVGVFPNKEIMSGVTNIFYMLLIGAMALTLMIILCSLKISEMVTDPITKLKTLMKSAEQGELDIHYEVTSQDEIGQLGNSFNQMIGEIKKLLDMVYMEQKSKRNAELKSLQEQIKPHFLYNTLDTISWMAREYEAKDIVMLVDALTNMFRIGLSCGKDEISLEEELRHVENYLYIQKVRYKEKLQYEIRCEDSLKKHIVPKLILQPLVENAIYHGIKLKRGGGSIRITVMREGETLLLGVSDTGAGITAEKCTQLNEKLARKPSLEIKESFGLYYIKDRIKLSFGNEYGIRLESQEEGGTLVQMKLPILE